MTGNKSSSTVTYQGQTYHYDYFTTGNEAAPDTLLLGGVLQDRASWKNYVREFSKYSNVLVIDFPGVGEAGILPANYGFDFLADCVHQVLEDLNIQLVNIFSTSYSTITAFEFSKRYPYKVKYLAISSSMTHIPEAQMQLMQATLRALENNDLDQFGALFYKGISNPTIRPGNADLVERVIKGGIKAMTNTQILQFCENTKRVILYDRNFTLKEKIALSPFIFTGELDTFTPPELCRAIGNYFQDFHFRTIPGYDHFFHIGNTKLIFNTLIPYFLSGAIPDFAHAIRQHDEKS